ncbi:HlyD family efflux transporter periplasmic adaptor subunit [Pseudonocardia alaniniphila]|uniref:HlyD family efflux transporter periplasmic adaptor subunit n=1 Tax=Pseudonocardia alaniniphila TaxID=75291 RepID=A0ABS9TQM0_9PSEU|nr:HlyD family efflux transporter periplasmic adaptor subunit [Pseudonocardia alaniniphila]MCH6170837.1 HlyD family efflux transporter periplasmic adaptor subunit [Pseudonocardia alaniniphila]
MVTERIAAQPAGPPPSRWSRLRSRFDAMTPRTKWLNLILIVLLILAIVLAFALIGNPSTPTVAVRTAAVVRGAVTSSVTGSGNTESSVSTPVGFQAQGTVTAVTVKAGDTVTLGEVLATVDPTSAKGSLETARAQLASAQAALAQARSGPTAVKSEQDKAAITQAQAELDGANANVTTAQNQLGLDTTSAATAISNAQQKLSDDQASTDTSVKSAQASLGVDEANEEASVEQAQQALKTCQSAGTTTGATSSSVAPPPPQPSPPAPARPTTAPPPTATPRPTMAAPIAFTTLTRTDCNSQQQALDNAERTRDSVLQKDRVAVTAAQQAQATTVDADQQAVTTAQQTQDDTLLKDNQAIATAKQTVITDQGLVTNAQLAQQADLHPMTDDQIAGYAASVDEAQVTVDNAQLGVDQTSLLAPQAGVVLAVNGKVGESSSGGPSASTTSGTSTGSSTGSAASAAATSAGSGFITIANLSRLAVTANIAEADAAKIKLGQKATITFPATNTTATGSVTQITPQSTVTNNVVLYPIQVSLDTAPPGVGVGSTASLNITAGSATDVLEAPNLAITSLGDRHTVTVQRTGTDTVVPVTIGLVGDTQTEITSGVQAGDVLVLPSTTAPTAAGAGAGFPRAGG